MTIAHYVERYYGHPATQQPLSEYTPSAVDGWLKLVLQAIYGRQPAISIDEFKARLLNGEVGGAVMLPFEFDTDEEAVLFKLRHG